MLQYIFCLLGPADAPILGVVPWADTLDQPSVLDLEQMFDTTALAGRDHLLRRCSGRPVAWNAAEPVNLSKQAFGVL